MNEQENINLVKQSYEWCRSEAAETMADTGLRVIALAYRRWDVLPSVMTHEAVETNLELVALIGIADPLRSESHNAVQLCKTAGIVPVMVTGDHPLTARMIANQVGIMDSAEDTLVNTSQLDEITDEALQRKSETY